MELFLFCIFLIFVNKKNAYIIVFSALIEYSEVNMNLYMFNYVHKAMLTLNRQYLIAFTSSL